MSSAGVVVSLLWSKRFAGSVLLVGLAFSALVVGVVLFVTVGAIFVLIILAVLSSVVASIVC